MSKLRVCEKCSKVFRSWNPRVIVICDDCHVREIDKAFKKRTYAVKRNLKLKDEDEIKEQEKQAQQAREKKNKKATRKKEQERANRLTHEDKFPVI